MKIHPSAVIHKDAKLGTDVEVGPYAVIGENAEIGEGVKIFSHAVVGSPSQDLKYHGEETFVRIGPGTVIREFVTINSATGEGEETVIGSNCFIMAYAHIAHNCRVGNGVVIANCGTLAGHVDVEDKAVIGGLVAVHQFCRIGSLSLLGGCSKVVQDVPPFMIADGHPAAVRSLNTVGLKRNGVSPVSRNDIKKAFKLLYRSGLSTSSALREIERLRIETCEAVHLMKFIRRSKRGIC